MIKRKPNKQATSTAELFVASTEKAINPVMLWRFSLFTFCLLVGISALIWQSYQLITEQGERLKKSSRLRIERTKLTDIRRGTIFDSENQVIAVDISEYLIAIDPKYFFQLKKGTIPPTSSQYSAKFPILQKLLLFLKGLRKIFTDEQVIASAKKKQLKQQSIQAFDRKFKKISNMLSIKPAELLQAIQIHHQRKPDSEYFELPIKVSATQADALKKVQLKPLIIRSVHSRSYPHGEIFSNIIGYLKKNRTRTGIDGIEKLLNSELSGTPGKQITMIGMSGETIAIKELSQIPVAGKDIYLTLDARKQFFLNKVLRKQLIKHKANSAIGILIEIPSGDIKAIVSQPNFNPNNLAERTNVRTRMRAILDRFAPGSTQKPLLVMAALEASIIQEETTYKIPRRFEIKKDNYVITENYHLGNQTVTDIVKYSINTGIVKIALQTPRKLLWDLYYKLGYHTDHNYLTGLKGAGTLAHFDSWNNQDYYVRSYGYKEQLSLLEVANFYIAIANDGILPPVRMLRKPPQSLKDDFEHAKPVRVISSKAAKQMLKILREVVKSGSGRGAKVKNYQVAGKTGTAKKVKSGKYRNVYRSSFIGIIPADKPQYVLAISIDEPKASQELFSGGQVVAPIFSEVMTEVMKLTPLLPKPQLPSYLKEKLAKH